MLLGVRLHSLKRRWPIGIALFLAIPASFLAVVWLSLPDISQLDQRGQTPSTRILDRNGRLLYEVIPRGPHSGRHTPVPLARIPLHLRQATIAVEDANFYANPGVDLIGIARALWINLRGGEALAGGSTITQQVARLILLDPEERIQRTLLRKLRESLLAWQIAQRYTKDDVLALYLNQAYYGNLAYGVEAAARAYFGKSVSELDLAECALLAGLPQAPARYDPLNHPEAARQRQAVVLDLMVKQGMISPEAALAAKRTRLSFAPAPFSIRAPHFVSYVRNWLERQFGPEAIVRDGLVVTTTLDLALNDAAQAVVRAQIARLASPPDRPGFSHDANNAALVALDPSTGEILAMVGSPDYFDARISGAVNAAVTLRQPGSAIKPITYAAAFARGALTAATPIYDVRTAFPTREGLPYVPVNYDRRHYGPISARQALATSNNTAAVHVLHKIGMDAMLAQAHALGLASLKDKDRYGLALTLGGGEVRLLELTAAYGAFANGGLRVTPHAVIAVSDRHGTLRYHRADHFTHQERALDARVAWLISDILADHQARAPAFGEFSILRLSRPAAAKTGTTTDFRDNWTIGYTPQIVAGVWVGNADGRPMQGISGVSGAGPIWHDFMEIAHRSLPVRWFQRPAGLVRVEVCVPSGLLPTPDCPLRRQEWFIAGSAPTQPDTWHRRVAIDALTGQLAGPDTPPARVVWRIMLDLPAELRDWARAQGWPLLPSSGIARADAALVITQPDPGAIFRLSKALPRAVQRIPVEVRANISEVMHVEVVGANDDVLARFDQPPYRLLWPLQAGEHTLIARAHLRDGRVLQSAPVRFTVLP
jgi:1A family penicillin-binding protein